MIAASPRSRIAKLLRTVIALILALAIPVQAMAVLAAKFCDSSFEASAAPHHGSAEAPQSPAAESPPDSSLCPPCDTCCAAELISVVADSWATSRAEADLPAAGVHSASQSDPTLFFRPPRPL